MHVMCHCTFIVDVERENCIRRYKCHVPEGIVAHRGVGLRWGLSLAGGGGFLSERVSVSEGIVDGRVATSLSGLLVYWKEGAMLVVASPPE
jgi:hypothetical protein